MPCDRFAPDADTPEAKDSASRLTVPAPRPELPEDEPSGVHPANGPALDEPIALTSILRLAVAPHLLREMKLDAAMGFLLSLVDGRTTVEELLDLCAMPHAEALRLLSRLRFLRIIAFEEVCF